MTTSERFAHLQGRWQQADEKWRDYEYALRRQYGDERGYCWNVPNGKRERQDRLMLREQEACERFLSFLETLNPARSWRRGFPIGWLMTSLTYADATTTGRMDVTPPPAYGFTQRDAEAFSGPVAA